METFYNVLLFAGCYLLIGYFFAILFWQFQKKWYQYRFLVDPERFINCRKEEQDSWPWATYNPEDTPYVPPAISAFFWPFIMILAGGYAAIAVILLSFVWICILLSVILPGHIKALLEKTNKVIKVPIPQLFITHQEEQERQRLEQEKEKKRLASLKENPERLMSPSDISISEQLEMRARYQDD